MNAIIKPTLLKIILTLILLVAASLIWRAYMISTISDTFPWGVPLQFYMAWGPCPPGEICSETNVFFLILDLAFWYLVSGILITKLTIMRT